MSVHRDLTERIRALSDRAKQDGGLVSGLMLDAQGDDPPALGPLHRACRYPSRSRGRTSRNGRNGSISEVVLLLGGPKGIDRQMSHDFTRVLQRECFRVNSLRLPGGDLHSNVALAGLFLLMDWDPQFWNRVFKIH